MNAPHRWALGICAALVCALTAGYSIFDFHFAFNNDTLNFSHNRAQAMQAALRAGDMPLWNRLEGAGLDQWAEGSKDLVLAPLLLVLDARSYLAVGGFIYLAAAILGFYWFATNVGFRPWPALVGGTIWATNGFALWHLHELNKQTVMALTPLVLGATALLDTRPRLAHTVLIAAAAVGVTYGRLDLFEYSYLTAALFAVVWFQGRRRLTALRTLVLTGVTGLLVAGWFVAPYAHVLATSARIDRVELPNYLDWSALRLHVTPSAEGLVGSRSYFALVALPLGVIGWSARRWDTRLGAILIGLYVVLAYDTGAYALVQALPLHGATPEVVRFVVLFFFGIALLATRGLDVLESGSPSSIQRSTVVLALTLVAAGAIVRAVLRGSGVADHVVTLSVAQLLVWTVVLSMLVVAAVRGWRVLNRVALVTIAVGALAFGWAFDRVNPNDGDLADLEAAYFGRLTGEVASPAPALLEAARGEPFRVLSETAVHPTFWAAQGVESLAYYTPFADRRLFLYADALRDETGESALARAGNVRFICTVRRDVPRQWRAVFTSDETTCFERPDFLPRVRLVGNVRVIAPDQDPIAAVSALGEEDPTWLDTGVVLEQNLPTAAFTPVDSRQGRAQLRRRDTNLLEVLVTSPSGTILTIAERFDEGWRASIDGDPAGILRANALFQAVVVPPGDHVVTFRYRSPYLVVGLVLSLVGVLVTWWWVRRLEGQPVRRRGP